MLSSIYQVTVTLTRRQFYLLQSLSVYHGPFLLPSLRDIIDTGQQPNSLTMITTDSARVQTIRYVEELQGQLHQTALQLDKLLAACPSHKSISSVVLCPHFNFIHGKTKAARNHQSSIIPKLDYTLLNCSLFIVRHILHSIICAQMI